MSASSANLLESAPPKPGGRARANRFGFGWWIWPALLIWFAGVCQGISADQSPIGEYQLKAAFLPQFPLYVEWPASNAIINSPELVIGVLGENPFDSHLEIACRGKTIGGKALAVKMCRNADEAKTCQVVFIAASEQNRLPEILTALEPAGVLTVGDLPDFAAAGGMIGLVIENRKIHLEINMAAVRKAGLKMDPQLLRLARVLHSEAAALPAKK